MEQIREVTGQPTGLDLFEVATSKIEEGVLGVDSNGLDQRLEKAGPSSLKPKSTWTKFNRMDFGLGGLSKALKHDKFDNREPKLGKLEMEMLLKILYRRGWRATLAGSNEDPKLELSRAWEPLDRT